MRLREWIRSRRGWRREIELATATRDAAYLMYNSIARRYNGSTRENEVLQMERDKLQTKLNDIRQEVASLLNVLNKPHNALQWRNILIQNLDLKVSPLGFVSTQTGVCVCDPDSSSSDSFFVHTASCPARIK